MFNFHESPKFLLAIGKDQEAIDVVHKIAAFNRQPAPQLSIKTFEALVHEEFRGTGVSATAVEQGFGARANAAWKKGVALRVTHLKAMFSHRLQAITLVLLWLYVQCTSHLFFVNASFKSLYVQGTNLLLFVNALLGARHRRFFLI